MKSAEDVHDTAVPVLCFLLVIAFSPILESRFWAPKACVLLFLTAFGAPRLALAVARKDRAAVAGAVVVLLSGVSAVRAQDLTAWIGLHNWGTGWLFTLSLISCWAAGATLSERGRRRFAFALLAGVTLAVAVAVLQVLLDLGGGLRLSLLNGRATGLVGNPAQLGILCAGTLSLTLLAAQTHRWLMIPLAAVAAVGVQISGTRVALGVVVLLLGLALWRRRLAAVPPAMAAICGLVTGIALVSVSESPVTATDRLEATAGSLTARLEMWQAGLDVTLAEPLLGVGPGRFRDGTSPRRTAELALAEGPDQLFVDAHNIVIEHATTTGILGVTSLLVFLCLALHRARGAFLFLGGALLVGGMLQPQSVTTTPLAFLAIGAGSLHEPHIQLRRMSILQGLLVLMSTFATIALLSGEYFLHEAELDFDPKDGRAAERLLPNWPETASQRAKLATFAYIDNPDPLILERAIDLRFVAAKRDPEHPALWNDLAELEASQGRYLDAQPHYERALARDPYSVRALTGLGQLHLIAGNRAEALHVLERAYLVAPTPEVAALVERAREG